MLLHNTTVNHTDAQPRVRCHLFVLWEAKNIGTAWLYDLILDTTR